jgi:hypothetical protein
MRLKGAQQIFDLFLKPEANTSIEIDDALRNLAIAAMATQAGVHDLTIFDSTYNMVLSKFRSQWTAFLQTKEYEEIAPQALRKQAVCF